MKSGVVSFSQNEACLLSFPVESQQILKLSPNLTVNVSKLTQFTVH